MKRIDIALLLGLVLSVLLTSFSAFADECDDIRQNVVRLHILANSDDDADQALKLQVRDAVLAGTEDLFSRSGSKAQAQAQAEGHLADIQQIAQDELRRLGCDYPVQVRLVNRFFDTRVYEDFTLPAGRYDAVQIEIGAGEGKNWWCVMFPPMCLTAAMENDGTPLEEKIYELGQPPRYKPAFAVVEAIETLQERLSASKEAVPE